MAAGGLGYLADSFTGILAPQLSAPLSGLLVLGGVAQLLLGLWLARMGARPVIQHFFFLVRDLSPTVR